MASSMCAEDKASGHHKDITITNDKGRLSQEEIDRMVKEAEDREEEDQKTKERIDARNAFDGYLHSVRSAVEGSGDVASLSDKLSPEEKSALLDAIEDGQRWIESNGEADVDEIKQKEMEVKETCGPIISKYYGTNGDDDRDTEDTSDAPEYDEL